MAHCSHHGQLGFLTFPLPTPPLQMKANGWRLIFVEFLGDGGFGKVQISIFLPAFPRASHYPVPLPAMAGGRAALLSPTEHPQAFSLTVDLFFPPPPPLVSYFHYFSHSKNLASPCWQSTSRVSSVLDLWGFFSTNLEKEAMVLPRHQGLQKPKSANWDTIITNAEQSTSLHPVRYIHATRY